MRIYITGINWFPYNNCDFVKIFIDNGQGKFTPSKRSPYGQFPEGADSFLTLNQYHALVSIAEWRPESRVKPIS